MLPFSARGALGAAAFLSMAAPAAAHVTLATRQAEAGAVYTGVARVPHGCDGLPTTILRIAIPAGILDVKPADKPGWTVAVVQQKYAKPFVVSGREVLAGVSEIVWSGGSLPADQTGEFAFTGRIAPDLQGRTLAFPVTQECGAKVIRWADVAAAGQPAAALASPAPTLEVLAPGAGPKSYTVGALTIEQPWARATPGGAKVGGGYMHIVNAGKEPDRLVGGSVAVSGRFEVHEMSMDAGVMRMKPAGPLAVPAGGSLDLKPGGNHAMFLDLTTPLKEGERVKGTLTFEKAGPVSVEYVVRGIGAGATDEAGHQH